MMDCIFCKFVAKEIPCSIVYEDDNVFAFLDINPAASGHTLLIPKKHSPDVHEASVNDLHNMVEGLQKVSTALKKSLGCEGISVRMNNGENPETGQLVRHIHFHIIPRYAGDGLTDWPRSKYEEGQIEELAEKIRSSLG